MRVTINTAVQATAPEQSFTAPAQVFMVPARMVLIDEGQSVERVVDVATQSVTFSQPDASVTYSIAELRAAVAAYDAAVPPVVAPPVVAPPIVTPPIVTPPIVTPPIASPGSPVVGVPYSWVTPITRHPISFVPTRVIRNQTFTSADTALNLEAAGRGNNTVYENCTFSGGRYAIWLSNQRDMAFIDCFATDVLQAINDESTVRIMSCQNILFLRTRIESYGPKHAFRVHGNSDRVSVVDMTVNSRGNGMMFGSYGDPVNNPVTRNLEMENINIQGPGPDQFNPTRDGKIIGLRVNNMTISPGGTAMVTNNTQYDWTFTNIRRGT